MAVEQTAALNNTLLLRRDATPISSFPFRSINLIARRRLTPTVCIKCSFDYNGDGDAASSNNGIYEYERYATAAPQYPRPPEIRWKKELCNSVQLISVVGAPIQIKHLASEKCGLVVPCREEIAN